MGGPSKKEIVQLRLRWPNRDTSFDAPPMMEVELRHHAEHAKQVEEDVIAYYGRYLQ